MSTVEQSTLLEEVTRMRDEFQSLKMLVSSVLNEVGRPADAKPGPATEWISGDEACLILGIPKSKSNTHLNRLTWLRKSGYLSRFGCRKPYTYSRKEVLEVLSRIQRGVLAIPARA
jgi:hypothetical protein